MIMITLSQPSVGVEDGVFLGDLPVKSVKHCLPGLPIAVLDYIMKLYEIGNVQHS